ncbi:MAG: plasmid pRiA4b ORF-3 family protein [Actinomycetota bacterium]
MSRSRRNTRDKQNRKTLRRAGPALVQGTREPCRCPACSGEDVDAAEMLGALLESAATLAEFEDPLQAELAGASLVALVVIAGDEVVPAVVGGLIPQIEAEAGSGGLALLLAIGAVAAGAQDQVAKAASAAARRLVAAGVPEPRWGPELTAPIRVGDCLRLYDVQGTTSVLAARFERAGRGHAFLVVVDEVNCGAAAHILFLDATELPAALEDLRAGGRAEGLDVRTQELEPAALRWYVEEALQARAVHDEEGLVEDDEDDEEAPPYPVLAQLVRTRLAALPKARRPAEARRRGHADAPAVSALEALATLLGGAGGGPRDGRGGPALGRPALAKLPPKRKASDGAAPIYQVKVGLRGAKPPIWRRLLVPADVSLAGLHDLIQIAFGWHGGHLHVFETPYGDFGLEDRELGHRAEGRVTLEQVAPQATDRIRYTYDFGDDWVHEIVVEKVLDRSPTLAYPSCLGGRRAAPPEDCGGVWGYDELVEILADPQHPEHQDRLDWLGLADASQFDPAAFDVDEVNRALARLR